MENSEVIKESTKVQNDLIEISDINTPNNTPNENSEISSEISIETPPDKNPKENFEIPQSSQTMWYIVGQPKQHIGRDGGIVVFRHPLVYDNKSDTNIPVWHFAGSKIQTSNQINLINDTTLKLVREANFIFYRLDVIDPTQTLYFVPTTDPSRPFLAYNCKVEVFTTNILSYSLDGKLIN